MTPDTPRARRDRSAAIRWRGVLTAVVVVAVGALVSGAGVATASGVVPLQAPAPAASLEQVLNNLRNWIMGIAGLLATVFLTIGAVRYMAAAGDLGEVEKAKTAFRSAAFGYAVVVLAPLLVSVLAGIVGA